MTPPVGRSARSLFADRSFRVYWCGGFASNVGTWLQNVTAAVVILDLTHSPFMVGVLSAATFLPILLLSLVGGSLSDKYDKRLVVVATQAFSLAVGRRHHRAECPRRPERARPDPAVGTAGSLRTPSRSPR